MARGSRLASFDRHHCLLLLRPDLVNGINLPPGVRHGELAPVAPDDLHRRIGYGHEHIRSQASSATGRAGLHPPRRRMVRNHHPSLGPCAEGDIQSGLQHIQQQWWLGFDRRGLLHR